MKLFIWTEVDDCGSGRYHNSGGLVIVTETLQTAQAMFAERYNSYNDGALPPLLPEPDHTYEVPDGELFIMFPDAGCC